MRYRLLEPDEWDKIRHLIPHEYLPTPEVASFAVAEDFDGKIQGVLGLQIQLHMEPLVLTSPAVNFKSLYDVIYNALDKGCKFYCFSNLDVVGRMAEYVGMKVSSMTVYEGEVK